ncbi:unnamed protein product [Nyctereutes procyonoides]|uniref:(raccoon dog) hypothetical protein n=1 Tax=Nyctereutes procyonoides TaxID=34880 RepID=A0A811Z903_NYCPR|nr:unnamed protein product [Nyctereutes procyonoides]
MYGWHNLWDLLIYDFCAILLLLVLPPSHSTPDLGFRWRFYMTETWDQGIWSHLISTTDCQPRVNSFISFDPIICFIYDQTHPTCQNYWVETKEAVLIITVIFITVATSYILTILDPWYSRWAMGVTAKLYRWPFSSYPTTSLQIYRTHMQVSLPQIQSALRPLLLDKTYPTRHFPCQPFWHGQSVPLFYLCRLVAVPFCNAFNCTNPTSTSLGPSPPLHDIPLFTDPLNHQFPFCYSTPNSSLCNITLSNVTSHHAPIGGFFWCNGTLSKSLNTSASLLCLPAEVALLTSPPEKQKPAFFLPLVIGVPLASTLVATGLGMGALIHSVHSTRDLSESLQMAKEASAESPASLQCQMTSVAQMALQNRGACDLLTTDKGGACMFLNEGCCYYINDTGIAETNLHTLAKVHESLQNWYHSGSPTTPQWWQTPLTTWLLLLLSPLLIIDMVLMVAPSILQFIQERIGEMSHLSTNSSSTTTPACPLPRDPTMPPTQQEVARSKRRPITTKGLECWAGGIKGDREAPTK